MILYLSHRLNIPLEPNSLRSGQSAKHVECEIGGMLLKVTHNWMDILVNILGEQ